MIKALHQAYKAAPVTCGRTIQLDNNEDQTPAYSYGTTSLAMIW